MTKTVRLVVSAFCRTGGFLTALLVLPVSDASAQVLCKCAFRPLESFICENDLTAQVRVRFGLSLPNGNRVYRARVLQTFHGEAASEIWIETPASCGFELRALRTYAVSINVGESGVYTTFACGSFVTQWRDLSKEELSLLSTAECFPTCDDVECASGETCILDPVVCVRAPCPPLPICVPDVAAEDEVCYRFVESDSSLSVDRPCDEGLKCVAVTDASGFNVTRVCKPQVWCLNPELAASQCDGLPHPLVLGNWSCSDDQQCIWQAGEPAP